MKKKLTSLILAIAICFAAVFTAQPEALTEASTSYDDKVILEVTSYYTKANEQLELLNEERSDAGVSGLTMDATLQSAAMLRAAELAVFFSHTRPNGTTCFTVSSLVYAENIAMGISSAETVTSRWMASSGHKTNMLNSSYTTVGIGCVTVGSTTYWVELFGTGTATSTSKSGTKSETYTIYTDYDTIDYDSSGFNLSETQSSPEPLNAGDTYQLTVGINSRTDTSPLGYTWTSSNTSVLTVDKYGLVTAAGTGTATITATSWGGYTWTKTFKVTAKSISSATVTLSSSSYTYDGSAKKPTPTVTLNGTTLTKGTDYTVSYSNNTDAGTATVTITGKGKYTGTVTKTFTINRKSISSGTVTFSASAYYYYGSAVKPSITLTVSSNTLTSGTDYTISYSNNSDIGTATATITGTGNYKGTLTSTYTIKPAQVVISSAASSASGKLTVRWTKLSGTPCYQLAYMKYGAGSWSYASLSSSAVGATLSGLTSGCYYYISVRAYKTVDGTTYYGPWATTQKVYVQ